MKHPHLQIQTHFGLRQEKGQELLEGQDVYSQLQQQEANARLSLHHKNPQSTNLCYPDQLWHSAFHLGNCRGSNRNFGCLGHLKTTHTGENVLRGPKQRGAGAAVGDGSSTCTIPAFPYPPSPPGLIFSSLCAKDIQRRETQIHESTGLEIGERPTTAQSQPRSYSTFFFSALFSILSHLAVTSLGRESVPRGCQANLSLCKSLPWVLSWKKAAHILNIL